MDRDYERAKESNEAVKVKTRKKLEIPSQKEVDDHYATNHVPYRSWCNACVMGKCVNNPHRQMNREEEDKVSTVSMDYGFMTTEKEGEEMGMAILVAVDRNTKKV